MVSRWSRRGISTVAAVATVLLIAVIVVSAVFATFAFPSLFRPAGSRATGNVVDTSTIGLSTSTFTNTTGRTRPSGNSTSSSTDALTNESSTSGQSAPRIFVQTMFWNGTSLPGVYTELVNSSGRVASGFTPITFYVMAGQNYSVIVSDSPSHYFNHWSDGFTSRVYPVAVNSSMSNLTAVFTPTQQAPPPTPFRISVYGSDLNGTALVGFLIDLRVDGYPIASGYTPVVFNDLEPGIQYQVVAYWAGDYYFRNFGADDLNRYALVTFNSTGPESVSLVGRYQLVLPQEGSALDVIAQLPNGTILGTTFNMSDYIQHTPGMWLTVTQTGDKSPFTGSYTGGSTLPFILLKGETYTIQMTLGYGSLKFAYWKDTNSSDSTRTIFLDQNTTLVAVYENT